MESLQDVSWMKYLYAGTVAERFEWERFRVASVIVPLANPTHNERYRFRMFFFEGQAPAPSIAVNMESDLLGTWKLTVQTSRASHVIASFDQVPDYEAWRSMAVAAIDSLDATLKPPPLDSSQRVRPKRKRH